MPLIPSTENYMNILRPNHLAKKLGMSPATLWRRVKQDPDFPQPVRLSSGMTGFVEAESDAYIERKVDEFRANPTKRTTASVAAAASVKVRADRRQAERQEAHHAQV
jgi:predicted DNA-binding transcriptional regulator AlpA